MIRHEVGPPFGRTLSKHDKYPAISSIELADPDCSVARELVFALHVSTQNYVAVNSELQRRARGGRDLQLQICSGSYKTADVFKKECYITSRSHSQDIT